MFSLKVLEKVSESKAPASDSDRVDEEEDETARDEVLAHVWS